jgi:hypothetical protein
MLLPQIRADDAGAALWCRVHKLKRGLRKAV